ncbi:hypothetical protein [Marinicella meishanensis]|uniref:hypothetical protein n=1 Tax=Marinicella meishanensis TaxID=2873263 RepID=UPI001CBD3FD1|nr:hypothetical protein [Marinicella sp. NBU2979]
MTQAKQPILTTVLLIGGCFLLLSVPSWVALPMLGCALLWSVLHFTCREVTLWQHLRAFIIEFFGFCCLVACFTGTMVAMYGLLFA